jgi:hypothetical protein
LSYYALTQLEVSEMEKLQKKDLLPPVWAILRRRYADIALLTGQGVIRGERVEFLHEGKPARCVIKTSTGGRISFGKRAGGWSGLEDSKFVVVVAPTALDETDHMVSMFDQHTMREVFDENEAAQKKAGMDLPNWIAPFHEHGRGPRGVGDGFGDRALWIEPLAPEAPSSRDAHRPKTIRALTVEEAKLGLAKKYSVSPEAIEISIRW